MSHITNGSDHLQEPALRYARQDFPIIRDRFLRLDYLVASTEHISHIAGNFNLA